MNKPGPPLALTQVDLVLRNGGWRHAMRLDADAAAGLGALCCDGDGFASRC